MPVPHKTSMEPILTITRLNFNNNKGGKLIEYIALLSIFIAIGALFFVEKKEGLVVAMIFMLMLYAFQKLSVAEKIEFYENEVRQLYFGKVKKVMTYDDIQYVGGWLSGITNWNLKKAILKGQVPDNVQISGRFFIKDVGITNLKEESDRDGFKFIVLSTEVIDVKKLPRTYNSNKNVIIMHYNKEVVDLLILKGL
jgi:hypothetical protein